MSLRELCAYHEAGHAVLALRAGLSIEEITVNDHGKGRCRIKLAERSFEDLGWLEKKMTMFWAGAIAQDRVWGGGRESSADDREHLEQLRKMLEIATGDERYAFRILSGAAMRPRRLSIDPGR